METHVAKALSNQFEAVQTLVDVVDALRVEDQSGAGLSDLALAELQKYAEANAQLKEKLSLVRDEHRTQVERLEASARLLKGKIQNLEQTTALEVHRLEAALSDANQKSDVLQQRCDSQNAAVTDLRQHLDEQQRRFQVERAELVAEAQSWKKKLAALGNQHRSAQQQHQRSAQQQHQQSTQQHLHAQRQFTAQNEGTDLSGQQWRQPDAGIEAHTGFQLNLQSSPEPSGEEMLSMLMLLPPKMWTVSQVLQWISFQPKECGVAQCAKVFSQHSVDGARLLQLKSGDLNSMGIKSAKHRKAIMQAVSRLTSQNTASASQQLDSSHSQ